MITLTEETLQATKLHHSVSITCVADFNNALENIKNSKCQNVAPKGPFADSYFNLCSASAGAKILFATDDWFATADNLLKDGPPLFDETLYCPEGKVSCLHVFVQYCYFRIRY